MGIPCGHAQDVQGCKFCKLATIPFHRNRWGVTSTKVGAAKRFTLPPCLHIGEATGEVRPCKSCGSRVNNEPLYACAVHGACSTSRLVTSADGAPVACCRICPDKAITSAATVVGLDIGGIGDALCVLAAAHGNGMQFIPPASRRPWIELFADIPDTVPSLQLKLANYKPNTDQEQLPRWEYWARLCGGKRKLPPLKPLPPAVLDIAIRYAGRIVLSPFSAHGPEQKHGSRCWLTERWQAVNRLLIEAGHKTLILDDRKGRVECFRESAPVVNEPGAYIRDRCDVLCGESPAMVAAVLKYATAFAGNDSGMAHLAGTLSVPGVAVCAACSDVRIFGCYPSIREIGGRGKDFLEITPEEVAEAIMATVRPLPGLAESLLPQDRWRLNAWHGVYRVLWETVKRLSPSRIVEIGTRAGYSAWTMLDACPGASVAGFDANIAEHGGFIGAMEHARATLPIDRFTLTIADSHALAELPAADLIYVDGDHTGGGCYQDLRLALTARPKWILVDDVANCWDMVKPACERFAKEMGITPEFIPSPTGLYLFDLRHEGTGNNIPGNPSNP